MVSTAFWYVAFLPVLMIFETQLPINKPIVLTITKRILGILITVSNVLGHMKKDNS